jgi:hypothetical protein
VDQRAELLLEQKGSLVSLWQREGSGREDNDLSLFQAFLQGGLNGSVGQPIGR